MAQVKWLSEALSDVDRLYGFLHDKDTESAARVAITILQGSRQLASFPQLGRPMDDETGRRELFVAFGAGAYVLRYMLEDEHTVIIIRVWHSRESR